MRVKGALLWIMDRVKTVWFSGVRVSRILGESWRR